MKHKIDLRKLTEAIRSTDFRGVPHGKRGIIVQTIMARLAAEELPPEEGQALKAAWMDVLSGKGVSAPDEPQSEREADFVETVNTNVFESKS